MSLSIDVPKRQCYNLIMVEVPPSGAEDAFEHKYREERGKLLRFLGDIDDSLRERGFTFDRPGFLGELKKSIGQLLLERFPDGVQEKTLHSKGEVIRKAEMYDVADDRILGEHAADIDLFYLDMFHSLRSQGLVADEDRESVINTAPRFSYGSYFFSTSGVLSDDQRKLAEYRMVEILDHERALQEFRKRPNIEAIDAAIEKREQFYYCFLMYARALIYERTDITPDLAAKSYPLLSHEDIARAEECARIGNKTPGGGITTDWGHSLASSLTTGDVRSTKEMLRMTQELQKGEFKSRPN
jgi:hypothetical protein